MRKWSECSVYACCRITRAYFVVIFYVLEFRMVIVRMLELHMLCVRFDLSRVRT